MSKYNCCGCLPARPIVFCGNDEIALITQFTINGSCECGTGCPFCDEEKFDEWWDKRKDSGEPDIAPVVSMTPDEIKNGKWFQTSRKYRNIARARIDSGCTAVQMLSKVNPEEYQKLIDRYSAEKIRAEKEKWAYEYLCRHRSAERVTLTGASFDEWLLSTGRKPGPSECLHCFKIEKSTVCSVCGMDK